MLAANAPQVKTPLWWALAAFCGLLLVVQLLLSSVLLLGDKSAAHKAAASGQRLWFPLSDSEASAQPITTGDDAAAQPLPESLAATADNSAASPADLMAEFAASGETLPEEAQSSTEPQEPAGSEQNFVASEEEVLDAIPAEPRTAASLTAPQDALLEPYADGALPMRDGDNTPFATYSRPFDAAAMAGGKPIIALVVSDLGSLRAQTEAATQLPADVTLAFNAYAQHSAAWLQTARNRGFESWLMLPAQPDSFPAGDGGPDALLVEQSAEEALARLKRTMARAHGYSGLMLPAGEIFSDHHNLLGWLYGQIESRGLALIAAQRPGNSAAAGWFRGKPLAYSADALIDERLSAAAIAQKLAALETHASQHGYAIGVIRPYPISLQSVQPWLQGLKAKGFVLAPASAVLKATAK